MRAAADVHAVSTMNYKRHYHPSQLLCPVARRGHWVDLTSEVLLRLDADLSAPLATVPVRRRNSSTSGSALDDDDGDDDDDDDDGEEDVEEQEEEGADGTKSQIHHTLSESHTGAEDGDDGDYSMLDLESPPLSPAAAAPAPARLARRRAPPRRPLEYSRDPEAVRAFALAADAKDAAWAQQILNWTMISLRDCAELVPYGDLSTSSKALLDRGMRLFLTRTDRLGLRIVVDPLGVASVEGRYKSRTEERERRRREEEERARRVEEEAARRTAAEAAAAAASAAAAHAEMYDDVPRHRGSSDDNDGDFAAAVALSLQEQQPEG